MNRRKDKPAPVDAYTQVANEFGVDRQAVKALAFGIEYGRFNNSHDYIVAQLRQCVRMAIEIGHIKPKADKC